MVFNTLVEVDSTNAGRNFADFLAESENRLSRLGVNLIFPVFETYLLQTNQAKWKYYGNEKRYMLFATNS